MVVRIRPPAFINTTPEIAAFINGLDPNGYLAGIIAEARGKLWENIYSGEDIKKEKIPKIYKRKHGINSLRHLDLDAVNRLVFSIVANDQGVGLLVVDIFTDHKSYNKTFGYKSK